MAGSGKQRRRRMVAAIASLALALGLVPATLAAGAEVQTPDGIRYELNAEKHTATVTDYVGTEASVTIPASINDGGTDYSVTAIGDEAFYDCESLESVTIPEGVESIGEAAFLCCYSLANVAIPEGVESIGEAAFSCCYSLANVAIPEGVKSIEACAFFSCESLASISIPSSVESIGQLAFTGCSALTSISVDGNNQHYSSDGGILYDKGGKTLVACPGGRAESVAIPDGVESIGEHAFRGCAGLASVAIPEGVTYIGFCAFEGCTNLASIAIPASVTDIAGSAFDGCSSLESVTIPEGVESIGTDAFVDCSSLSLILAPSTLRLESAGVPETTTILDYTRDGQDIVVTGLRNKELTSVTIPGSVKSIEDDAFKDCSSLSSILVPSSLTLADTGAPDTAAILDYTRNGQGIEVTDLRNKELESVTIPEGVTGIGDDAFKDCSNLSSILVPSSLDLENAGIPETTAVLDYTRDGQGIEVTGLRNKDLANVTIPEGVKSIGESAFYACDSLASVTIPDSVESIGRLAFTGCSALTSISVDGNNQHYSSDGGILYDKGKKTLITCPGGRSTNVTIPGGVESIEVSAFIDCKGLASVTIPDSVESIGDYAFMYCTQLATMTFGGSKPQWDHVVAKGSGWADFAGVSGPTSYAKWGVAATASPQGGGTVNGEAVYVASFDKDTGGTAVIEAAPNTAAKYFFAGWTEGGAPLDAGAAGSFAVEGGDRELVANFVKDFTVTVKGGTADTTTAAPGSTVHIEAGTPEAGEYFSGWTGNAALADATETGGKTTFTMPEHDVEVTANYEDVLVCASGTAEGIKPQTYAGGAVEPKVSVYLDGLDLWLAEDDYTVTYKDNVRAGTATVTVTLKSPRMGEASTSFEIARRPLTVTAKSARKAYDGTALAAAGFAAEGLAKGDRVASAKVAGSQALPGSSQSTVSGARIVNAAGEDVTGCYDIAYRPGTLTVAAAERAQGTKMGASGATGLTVAWAKVKGAQGYDVYFSRCDHGGKTEELKRMATVKAGGRLSWTATGLKKDTCYKARVRAWVKEGGEKRYVSSGPQLHLYTGAKYTWAKAVKVNKKKVTLEKGKAFKLKARPVKADRSKKLISKTHVAPVRYTSDDKRVAKVTKKGRVKARGRGTCHVYAYAHNGVYKKVKVTVR